MGLLTQQQLLKYLFGIRRRRVLKAPAHGDRVVEDERCQARPSLMRSLMVIPAGSRFPWRSSRICATASAGVLRLTSRDNSFPFTPGLDAFDDHFVNGTEVAILQLLPHQSFGFGFEVDRHASTLPQSPPEPESWPSAPAPSATLQSSCNISKRDFGRFDLLGV